MLLAGLASIAIVFPLWYGAIYAREVYTVAVICLLAALALLGVALRVRAMVQESGSLFRDHLLKALRKLLLLLLFLAFAYTILWLFARRHYYLALPLLVVYLLLLGLIKYGKKRGRSA